MPECNEDKKKKVRDIRDAYKKAWNKLTKNYFSRNLQGHVQDMQELEPVIKQLSELVKMYRQRFSELKREKAVMDFSDLEHYCLQLLMDESSTPDAIIPSSIADNLQQQFQEVLVDEYQDTNLVQETILQLVSDHSQSGNLFMVGDVKQSIYRFRHAEPGLFIEKYKHFANDEESGRRIDLASNFRSRELVLAGTNYIFRQIMDEKVGEISYDKDAELIYANHVYDDQLYDMPNPELIIIDREKPEEDTSAEEESGEEENYLDLEKAQLEARAYAQKIKQWIGDATHKPQQVFDKETQTQRDVQYRDIVILMRSMKNWAPIIVEEMKKQGIPVYAELSTGYFAAIEVKVMLSLLKTIDNPRQDIPLVSVLKSPIVGMNEEELSQIRLANPKSVFYDALKKYGRQQTDTLSEKVNRFLENLQRYREASRNGALSELIWQIYRETGYYDFVGGMPGGKQRQANLRALYDRARSYEASSFRGLFRFLRFIERMEENDQDLGAAKALSEQEDVVRIMSIHTSKGLEYPIVIIGAMDKEFNESDWKKPYLLHKNMGFASKYIDPDKRITYPTLYYHAVKNALKREALAEELRVLYVALTRAKEKLVMVANVASFEKKQAKWQRMASYGEWVLPAYHRAKSRSYLDLVGSALIRHQDTDALRTEPLSQQIPEVIRLDPSCWDISVLHGSEFANLDETAEDENMQLQESIQNWQPVPADDSQLEKMVAHRLAFRYPFREAAESRAKQTVTEIKRQQEIKDEFSSDQFVSNFQPPIVKRPAFMQRERTFSAAEKGTAMHTVMQHIPFNRQWQAAEIEEFVQGLVEREILLQEAADTIDTEAIAKFFETELAAYMAETSPIYREVPFSLALPAEEVYANWQGTSEEHVLIQGVLDCVIPKEDGWIILDYKTDNVSAEVTEQVKEKLVKRYEVQLQLYRKALQQIWQQPVAHMYLYFFSGQLLLEV
ncbi:helicase-exonuclease AddAB subunit AddA [Virgibacillus sp. 179-BFC.A HS]|uniref:DNA 3'-5' helicase n=1 Tax=Tigheibacillus jepli TaxID=3035914 RepID=A0ABU5CL56_9BACI|nr:helicase-exonuclease AddAB subunit AddA [Virgibacillus sp. 179-BFC.A HS]MDY0406210.1 helicase-exonuclease AddAB subunit AddA [Virgibacillus sp. 179-BFC.A HS]